MSHNEILKTYAISVNGGNNDDDNDISCQKIRSCGLILYVCILLPDIDECAKGICKNGATCVNLQGSYRCKCNSGYNGTNCEAGDD